MEKKFSILMRHDGRELTASSLDAAVKVIADIHNRHPSEVCLDDRSSSARTVEQWDAHLAGSGDRSDPVATITRA